MNTGLSELDELMTGEDERMMIIDVSVFDATILQFFITENEEYSKKDRFRELKNIWINYYKESFKDNFNPANIFATPFQIVDLDMNVVAITPPLIDDAIVPNINIIATSFTSELQHNGMEAKTRFLLDARKMFNGIGNNQWSVFIGEYLNKRGIITQGSIIVNDVDDWLKED